MQMKNQEKGLLIIGSIPVMAQYGIVNLLSLFQKKNPDNNVKILEDDPQNLVNHLKSRKCELIFLRESKLDFEKNFLEDRELIRIPLIQDHLVAILPAIHPLARNQQVSLRNLKNEKFCMIKEGTMMYNLCIDACHAAGFIPTISFTSHRIESILDMVCTEGCVGLLMNFHTTLPAGISILPDRNIWVSADIVPTIASQISLCYLADAPLSGTARKFVDYIQSVSLKGKASEILNG